MTMKEVEERRSLRSATAKRSLNISKSIIVRQHELPARIIPFKRKYNRRSLAEASDSVLDCEVLNSATHPDADNAIAVTKSTILSGKLVESEKLPVDIVVPGYLSQQEHAAPCPNKVRPSSCPVAVSTEFAEDDDDDVVLIAEFHTRAPSHAEDEDEDDHLSESQSDSGSDSETTTSSSAIIVLNSDSDDDGEEYEALSIHDNNMQVEEPGKSIHCSQDQSSKSAYLQLAPSGLRIMEKCSEYLKNQSNTLQGSAQGHKGEQEDKLPDRLAAPGLTGADNRQIVEGGDATGSNMSIRGLNNVSGLHAEAKQQVAEQALLEKILEGESSGGWKPAEVHQEPEKIVQDLRGPMDSITVSSSLIKAVQVSSLLAGAGAMLESVEEPAGLALHSEKKEASIEGAPDKFEEGVVKLAPQHLKETSDANPCNFSQLLSSFENVDPLESSLTKAPPSHDVMLASITPVTGCLVDQVTRLPTTFAFALSDATRAGPRTMSIDVQTSSDRIHEPTIEGQRVSRFIEDSNVAAFEVQVEHQQPQVNDYVAQDLAVLSGHSQAQERSVQGLDKNSQNGDGDSLICIFPPSQMASGPMANAQIFTSLISLPELKVLSANLQVVDAESFGPLDQKVEIPVIVNASSEQQAGMGVAVLQQGEVLQDSAEGGALPDEKCKGLLSFPAKVGSGLVIVNQSGTCSDVNVLQTQQNKLEGILKGAETQIADPWEEKGDEQEERQDQDEDEEGTEDDMVQLKHTRVHLRASAPQSRTTKRLLPSNRAQVILKKQNDWQKNSELRIRESWAEIGQTSELVTPKARECPLQRIREKKRSSCDSRQLSSPEARHSEGLFYKQGKRMKKKVNGMEGKRRSWGLSGPPGNRDSVNGWVFAKEEEAPRIGPLGTLQQRGIFLRPGDDLLEVAGRELMYCRLCNQKYDSQRLFICCNVCGAWFHGDTMGLEERDLLKLCSFKCHRCRKVANPFDSCWQSGISGSLNECTEAIKRSTSSSDTSSGKAGRAARVRCIQNNSSSRYIIPPGITTTILAKAMNESNLSKKHATLRTLSNVESDAEMNSNKDADGPEGWQWHLQPTRRPVGYEVEKVVPAVSQQDAQEGEGIEAGPLKKDIQAAGNCSGDWSDISWEPFAAELKLSPTSPGTPEAMDQVMLPQGLEGPAVMAVPEAAGHMEDLRGIVDGLENGFFHLSAGYDYGSLDPLACPPGPPPGVLQGPPHPLYGTWMASGGQTYGSQPCPQLPQIWLEDRSGLCMGDQASAGEVCAENKGGGIILQELLNQSDWVHQEGGEDETFTKWCKALLESNCEEGAEPRAECNRVSPEAELNQGSVTCLTAAYPEVEPTDNNTDSAEAGISGGPLKPPCNNNVELIALPSKKDKLANGTQCVAELGFLEDTFVQPKKRRSCLKKVAKLVRAAEIAGETSKEVRSDQWRVPKSNRALASVSMDSTPPSFGHSTSSLAQDPAYGLSSRDRLAAAVVYVNHIEASGEDCQKQTKQSARGCFQSDESLRGLKRQRRKPVTKTPAALISESASACTFKGYAHATGNECTNEENAGEPWSVAKGESKIKLAAPTETQQRRRSLKDIGLFVVKRGRGRPRKVQPSSVLRTSQETCNNFPACTGGSLMAPSGLTISFSRPGERLVGWGRGLEKPEMVEVPVLAEGGWPCGFTNCQPEDLGLPPSGTEVVLLHTSHGGI